MIFKSIFIVCVVSLHVLNFVTSSSSSNNETTTHTYKLSDEYIDQLNEVQTLWKAGRNFGADTPTESIRKLLGFKPNRQNGELRRKVSLTEAQLFDDIPSSFDCRTAWPHCHSFIGRISDQGSCGSCWAVATTDSISDRLCIASGGKVQIQILTLDLLQCDRRQAGCSGGDPYMAWQYFSEHGLVSGGGYDTGEGCKPYPFAPCEHHTNGSRPVCSAHTKHTLHCAAKCTNSAYTKAYRNDLYYGDQYYVLQPSFFGGESNERAIQRELMQHGPVTVAMEVYHDFLHYQDGIYFQTDRAIKSLGGHAVRLIGWGSSETGVDYWLVANSWNTDWGHNGGLFKIVRGRDECHIESWQVSGGIPIVV